MSSSARAKPLAASFFALYVLVFLVTLIWIPWLDAPIPKRYDRFALMIVLAAVMPLAVIAVHLAITTNRNIQEVHRQRAIMKSSWPGDGSGKPGRKVRTLQSAIPDASRDGATRWTVPQKLNRLGLPGQG